MHALGGGTQPLNRRALGVMISAEERESLVLNAVRFLARAEDDHAQNAYFAINEGDDAEASWSVLCEVATRSRDVADPSAIGAGLLESFIRRYGDTHAEVIANGVIGNSRLIAALPSVRGLHGHSKLLALLPVGLEGEN